MMDAQMGVGRDIHWESQLVQNPELSEAPLVRCQVENLRVQNLDILLVKNIELR